MLFRSDDAGSDTQTEQTGQADEPAITFAPDTPVAASVRFDHKSENDTEYAVITGADASGKQLWQVETPRFGVAQLSRVTGLDVRNNVYYYIEDGDVVTLSLADGSEVWRNRDFKGSPASDAWTFDANGSLYLCGYLGPDLIVINPQGKTVCRYAEFHTDYYWPYEIALLEGNGARITYEMGPGHNEGVLTVNVETGEVLGAEPTSGGADAPTDPTAVGVTLSASSTLQEKGQDHRPQCAKDGNRSTAWVEGGSSFDGWLKLDLATPTALNGLHIWSGYHKSQDLFYKNNRPHRISVMVEYDGGAQNFQFDLNDSMDVQTISFGENFNQVKITSITITILSVYSGTKYNDTCISEIQLY